MRIKKIILAISMTLAVSCAAAKTANEQHYVVSYENGVSYDVVLDEWTITWTGLQGPDKGHKETDLVKYKKLSDSVDVYQWDENSGAFVTLILDRINRTTVSSGTADGISWIASGTYEEWPHNN